MLLLLLVLLLLFLALGLVMVLGMLAVLLVMVLSLLGLGLGRPAPPVSQRGGGVRMPRHAVGCWVAVWHRWLLVMLCLTCCAAVFDVDFR